MRAGAAVSVLLAAVLGQPAAGQRPGEPTASGPFLVCGPVDIGGRSIHACHGGTTGPTLVFEAGMRDDHSVWARVAPRLAGEARVVTYDRAGNGLSDPAPGPRTPAHIASDLHALLTAVGAPPPYVLVGHSAGGWHLRAFAQQRADEVRGLLLVDSPHEDFEARRLETLDEADRIARMDALARSRAELPATIQAEYAGIDASRESFLDLGALPLVVLTAERHDWGPVGDPDVLETSWRALQEELSRLSTRGRLVVIPEADHQIPRRRPEIVIQWIRYLLETTPRSSIQTIVRY